MLTNQYPVQLLKKINDKLILKTTKDLNSIDITNGLQLFGSHIQLDKIYDQNDDFTMFIVFKQDTGFTRSDQYFAFGNNVNPSFVVHFPPFVKIKDDRFSIQKTSNTSTQETILSASKNKHLILWFTKNGNFYEVNLCDIGGLITETISSVQAFQANRILIHFAYHIQRIGFSSIFHAVNGPEFHKILFREKSGGTFFQYFV